jgi:uncharacterized protein (TIGR02284 family)
MDNKHHIGVLNTLITTTIDSALGFEESARNADNFRYSSEFRQFARDRREVVAKLQAEARRLGGTPADDGSVKATAHRRWVNFRNAVTGSSDKTVVSEVLKGEIYILNEYESALQEENLTPSTRTLLEEGLRSVRIGYARATAMDATLRDGWDNRSQSFGWKRKIAGATILIGAAFAAKRYLSSGRSQRGPALAHGTSESTAAPRKEDDVSSNSSTGKRRRQKGTDRSSAFGFSDKGDPESGGGSANREQEASSEARRHSPATARGGLSNL